MEYVMANRIQIGEPLVANEARLPDSYRTALTC